MLIYFVVDSFNIGGDYADITVLGQSNQSNHCILPKSSMDLLHYSILIIAVITIIHYWMIESVLLLREWLYFHFRECLFLGENCLLVFDGDCRREFFDLGLWRRYILVLLVIFVEFGRSHQSTVLSLREQLSETIQVYSLIDRWLPF